MENPMKVTERRMEALLKVRDLIKQLSNFPNDTDVKIMIISNREKIKKVYGKESILETISNNEGSPLITIFDEKLDFRS